MHYMFKQLLAVVAVDIRGADYDKAGGESAGAGGGSGAYISDKIFTVTEGETINLTSIGTAGVQEVQWRSIQILVRP
jgi:hypothetical protein